ncbi:beta-galactosidase [Arthrobacter psychrolactophilus]|uniref:Beta-galactosidase n=1 Tax=Arthrobacter psychrolactophilus TaxID=92442 RepID=A0A2V5IRA3_9MICC|nr:beta-galactosidase [Arthrobacter psychrolactophilus]PYI39055.1 beta-galactosidase [Arthrobacter psychrolactophilus]
MAELFDGRLLYGAALYPEVWDKNIVASDAALMAKLGMNVARMGEFIWSALEPDEGRIDLSILHDALNILDDHGIATILCTPTVTPPIWLTHGHQGRLHHTADGTALGHGSRQHVCTNGAYFRERAAIITGALAREFGQDRRVISWQLDNEFKSHVGGCHCPSCRDLWGQWLEAKYQDIAQLNEQWSTAVWSETYQSFDQIPLPAPTPFLHNTALMTAFNDFSQVKINEFAAEQSRIIRAHSELPITHNSGFGFDLDNQGLYSNLDYSSFDTYPAAPNYPAFLMNLDYFPHFGASGKTILMETSTSHGGSIANYGSPHPAGFVEAEIFANFAAGSKGFLFWPFRQHCGGSEQPHGAVVSPWGAPTIGFSSAARGGELLAQLETILTGGETLPPRVAITYSDRAKTALSVEPGGKLDYRGVLSGIHRRFVEAGIGRALIPEGASLDAYDVLLTPYAHHLDPEFLERVSDWVRAGGTWLVGPGTADRDAHHRWHSDAALGALESIAGVRGVLAFPATGSGTSAEFLGWQGGLDGMSTFMECTTARPLGMVRSGPAAGLAFVTENQGTPETGDGRVILVGSLPDGFEDPLLVDLLIGYATTPSKTWPARTEARELGAGGGVVEYLRRKKGRLQRWLVNMSDTTAELELPFPTTELLSNTNMNAGKYRLEPYTYIIAEERNA